MSPTWRNVVLGQVNLRAAVRNRLKHVTRVGKYYEQRSSRRPEAAQPTIVVRPRGLHLPEAHLRYVDRNGAETAASASLVDFGLYFFHNVEELVARGSGIYFCIPKIEGASEARWWNRLFHRAQQLMGITPGTLRTTVLIETVGAAIEMEEIVWELRDHCAGLHAGRWDFIFSMTKAFRHDPTFLLPDRKEVTMELPFLTHYAQRIIDVSHRRGVHALGGMATAFPDREDPELTATAQQGVREDKERRPRASTARGSRTPPSALSPAPPSRRCWARPTTRSIASRRPPVRVRAAASAPRTCCPAMGCPRRRTCVST